jgi:hypothetical protein
MMIVSDIQFVVFAINIANDAYRVIIDDSKVMLQIVASLTIVIYDCKMFIIHATE